MKVIVDEDKCIGSGQCVLASISVFGQRDEDGLVVLLQEDPPVELHGEVRQAVSRCPAQALEIEMNQAAAPTAEQVGEHYDGLASVPSILGFGDNLHFGFWEGPQDESDLATAMTRLTDQVIGRLGVTAGDSVLDVGCGVGGPAVRVARAVGTTVTGITVSSQQVEYANAHAAAEGVGHQVSFRLADAAELPFPDATFDAVFALESILHMDRPTVLSQIARVLRPGGRLVITDEFLPAAAARGSADPVLSRYLSNNRIVSLADFAAYPGLIADAGLLLDDLKDITDRTVRRTFLSIRERARTNLANLEQVKAKMPHYDHARRGESIDEGIPAIGYLLLTAHRPK